MKIKECKNKKSLAISEKKMLDNGITLIALVITIIILLILAGITINLALAPDGIVKRALGARDEYLQEQDKELAKLNDIENMLDKLSSENDSVTFYFSDGNETYPITIKKGMTWGELFKSDYSIPEMNWTVASSVTEPLFLSFCDEKNVDFESDYSYIYSEYYSLSEEDKQSLLNKYCKKNEYDRWQYTGSLCEVIVHMNVR